MRIFMGNLLNKIFSKKFLITTVLTVVFAIALRLFYTNTLHIIISAQTIDVGSLSFFTLVALFKAIVHIILEETAMGSIPMGPSNSNTLCMVDRSNTGASNPGTSSGSKPSSSTSSGSRMGGSTSTSAELYKLNEDFCNTLTTMNRTLGEMEKIKMNNKLSFFVSKNNALSMDVPTSVTDDQANDIRDKVADLDATYNRCALRYEVLLKVDIARHDKTISPAFNNNLKRIADRHKSLFEVE